MNFIAGQDCEVTSSLENQLKCTLSANNAGVKDIEVFVEELGYARTNDGVSFEYLLELDSVSPTSGTHISCQHICVFKQKQVNGTCFHCGYAFVKTICSWIMHCLKTLLLSSQADPS